MFLHYRLPLPAGLPRRPAPAARRTLLLRLPPRRPAAALGQMDAYETSFPTRHSTAPSSASPPVVATRQATMRAFVILSSRSRLSLPPAFGPLANALTSQECHVQLKGGDPRRPCPIACSCSPVVCGRATVQIF